MAMLEKEEPLWRQRLHRFFKEARRKTRLLDLESHLKLQIRRATGRKMTGRFKSVLEYAEWEHTHQTAAKD